MAADMVKKVTLELGGKSANIILDDADMVYIVDNYIVPNTAILDPRFTMTLPAFLTASSAMDAMTHAVEALTSIERPG